MAQTKRPVKLLVCKCEDCAHWEIGKDEHGKGFILCKTCGLELPATITVDDHHMLHYKEHER